jgi:hypothetical protein
VASAESSQKYQETDGFIPLPSHKPRPIEPEDYRSIGPLKDRSSESSSSSSATSDSDDEVQQDGDEAALSSGHEKMRSLEEQLSRDPSSVSTWLSLLSLSLSQVPAASKNSSKVRSEITLSILGRALPALQEGSSWNRIRLLYLHAGEESWTSEKLAQEWERALTKGDINIRLAWLNWRIRTGSEGVDGMLQAVTRVLELAANEVERLRIFWRLACALRQAGMGDLARRSGSGLFVRSLIFPQASSNDPWLCSRPKQTCIPSYHTYPYIHLPRAFLTVQAFITRQQSIRYHWKSG